MVTGRFRVEALAPSGLFRVVRELREDERGRFSRLFCADELVNAGWNGAIAQVNQSVTSRQGTVRGLHFQLPPHAEKKLVSCLRGEIWDVAVDLRSGSPTFLQWHAEILSEANQVALLIPEGFAHGFQALTDDAELLYCHSERYVPSAEGGLNPCDPSLSIPWPLPITVISDRDRGHAPVADGFTGLRV